ncbi:MAG TPA: PilZ domain-containing protein [Terriglobales bacterium]|nr:PilZ domain-containing protein [Terriglobales bacterium]
MSFETSGADYLRRLKQDLGQVRPFPESTPEPTAPETAGPGERRRNPRYKCEGSATFRVQGTNVRTWGTFTDLSISGCYIELKATFPVGAIVDLELELNSVRAEVKGEVRVSYPFLGMGVAFRDVTVESRQQIDAMIDTVRPSIPKAQPAIADEAVAHTSSMPIIVNAPAALQVLAEFFEIHVQLSKEEFVRLLRKSQGL